MFWTGNFSLGDRTDTSKTVVAMRRWSAGWDSRKESSRCDSKTCKLTLESGAFERWKASRANLPTDAFENRERIDAISALNEDLQPEKITAKVSQETNKGSHNSLVMTRKYQVIGLSERFWLFKYFSSFKLWGSKCEHRRAAASWAHTVWCKILKCGEAFRFGNGCTVRSLAMNLKKTGQFSWLWFPGTAIQDWK